MPKMEDGSRFSQQMGWVRKWLARSRLAHRDSPVSDNQRPREEGEVLLLRGL